MGEAAPATTGKREAAVAFLGANAGGRFASQHGRAFLQLDLAQRTKSLLRLARRLLAMRWVCAHANHCEYAEAYAAADARRASLDEERLQALSQSDYPGWSAGDRAALNFAQKMTVDSDSVTDAEFAKLVEQFGEKQAAAMVLLTAYANFQDRALLCLRAPIEPDAARIARRRCRVFAPEAFVTKTDADPAALKKSLVPKPTGKDLIEADPVIGRQPAFV